MNAANRDHVKMHVGDLETREHQPDARRLECRHLCFAYRLRGDDDVRQQVGLEIEPVIDLFARHHQRVAGTQRPVGEKRDAALVLPDESGR